MTQKFPRQDARLVHVPAKANRADQRLVSVKAGRGIDGDRDSSGVGSDAGDLPAAGDFLGRALIGTKEPVEGQMGAVAGDEIMFHVEGAKRSGQPWIEYVCGVLQGRAIVHALAVGIADKEFPVGGVLL